MRINQVCPYLCSVSILRQKVVNFLENRAFYFIPLNLLQVNGWAAPSGYIIKERGLMGSDLIAIHHVHSTTNRYMYINPILPNHHPHIIDLKWEELPIPIQTVLREKVLKMSWVSVIPKKGWVCIQLTEKNENIFYRKWGWMRPLGTFLHYAAQSEFSTPP